jgi:hypothetical protein
MYHDYAGIKARSRDLTPAGIESIESIEDLLRKCGFFDALVPEEREEEVLAS